MIRTVALGAALAAATASAAPTLCRPGETAAFSCPIGHRVASVCTEAGHDPVFRFGTPGSPPELEATGLYRSHHMTGGGGEDQIWFDHGGDRTIVYARTTRRGFTTSGRSDPAFASGVAVRHGTHTISDRRCGGSGDQPILSAPARTIEAGAYTEH